LQNQENVASQMRGSTAVESMEMGVFCKQRKFRLLRNERLKGRNDIQAVFKQGKNFGCKGAKLFVLKNCLANNRICFTCSRGFGNAVQRNRARRLGKEAYRLLKPRLHNGHDLVLLVFPETQASLTTRTKQLEFLFSKAGIIK